MLFLLSWVWHYIKWIVSSHWPAGEPNYLSHTQSVDSRDRGNSHAIICNECVAKEASTLKRWGVKRGREVEIRQQTVAASNWNKRADNATQFAAVTVCCCWCSKNFAFTLEKWKCEMANTWQAANGEWVEANVIADCYCCCCCWMLPVKVFFMGFLFYSTNDAFERALHMQRTACSSLWQQIDLSATPRYPSHCSMDVFIPYKERAFSIWHY